MRIPSFGFVMLSLSLLWGCSTSDTTYTLSGSVSGDVTSGVQIALSGGASRSTTTNASGTFGFIGLKNGSYTVTPTLNGYTFTPTSQNVTINGSDQNNVSFTAAATTSPTYEITGTITGDIQAGVSLALTGTASASTTSDTNGVFAFANLADGNYTITPSLAGYSFSPPSQQATISGADVGSIDFVATADEPTYTISGSVTGDIVQGVTIQLSGDASANTTTDANGDFSFTDLAAGTYSLVPSVPDHVFDPASRLVTVLDQDITGQDFSAIAYAGDTYTISGTVTLDSVGLVGVKLTLSGEGNAVGISEPNGDFSFAGLMPGTYVVTPTLAGHTLEPETAEVVIVDADISGVDFAASLAAIYSISGSVSGAVAAGVEISLSGDATQTTSTSLDGTYSFSGLTLGNYTVTPAQVGVEFTPQNLQLQLSQDVNDADFSASLATVFSISGTVSGDAQEGVTIQLTGAADLSTTTDVNGDYSFLLLTLGTYTLTPSLADHYFDPALRTVEITAEDIDGQDFSATAHTGGTYEISGTILEDAIGLAGVNVMLEGPVSAQTITDDDGNYSFRGLPDGEYAVDPNLAGYAFDPASKTTTIAGANQNDVDFGATVLYIYSISGTVYGDISAGVTLQLSGDAIDTIVTSQNGTYVFEDLPIGIYEVTPLLTGYTFSPHSELVVIAGASVTAIEFQSMLAPIFSISGSVSGDIQEGVTIKLQGTVGDETLTAADGSYEFTGLTIGSYAVIGDRVGYEFEPVSHDVTISDASITEVDFVTSLAPIYTISGYVDGDIKEDVTVTLSGEATAFTTTDVSGYFSFGELTLGSYSVTPSQTGYTFDPASQEVLLEGQHVTDLAFGASAAAIFSISGHVTDEFGGLGDVTITLAGDALDETLTDAQGDFVFDNLKAGMYSLTPSAEGYLFEPNSLVVIINDENVTGQDFFATASAQPTYSVSGAVTLNQVGEPGVQVELFRQDDGHILASVLTDDQGAYTITGVESGSYNLAATKGSYSFDPDIIEFEVHSEDVTNMDIAIKTVSISGRVTTDWDTGLAGVTLEIDPQPPTVNNATTDQDGWYAFDGIPNGHYIIRSVLAGSSASFMPDRQEVHVWDSDVYDVNFWAEVAVTITGSIDYAGAYTGRVYLLLRRDTESDTDLGTSVMGENFPVDFTIRGARPGEYYIEATMDILGYGEAHAASPIGNSTFFTVNTTEQEVPTFYLADVNPPQLESVEGVNAVPSDGVAFLMWGVQTDNERRVVPEYYNIYYGTQATVGPDNTTGGGSILDVLAAEDFGNYLVDGLTNGTTYYFALEACTSDGCAAPSPASTPTVIGNPGSGHTVSGQVLFSGIEPTGSLWIAVFGMDGDEPDFANLRISKMEITSNPQPFSVAGVADGDYVVFPLVDMNDNNQVGPGDVTPDDGPDGDVITIAGANVVLPPTLLEIESLYASAETRHHNDLDSSSDESYSVDLEIDSGIKLPVKVTLIEGKGALVPKDIGQRWDYYTWVSLNGEEPLIGDTYVFEVEYSDGTQEIIELPITGVVDSFATPTSPIGTATGQTHPTFTWTPPDDAPAWYTYELSIWEDQGSHVWYAEDIPQDATSLEFNFNEDADYDPLLEGVEYHWEIIIQDQNGNESSVRTSFTP